MKAETVGTSVPVKILCGCGQKYSFEAEPVDGRMGYAVQCPVCASDGTAAANQVIALHLAGQATSPSGIQFNPSVLAPTMPRPPSRSTGQNNFPLNAKRKWAIPLITATFVLLVAAAMSLVRTRHQRMDLVVLSNDATTPTLKELNARYVEPPAGQNAADFYLQGFESMRVGDVSLSKVPLLGSGKLPPLGSTRSGSVKLALAGVVQSNRDSLQFFEQGAKYEQSRYPIDLSRGLETTLPHLAKLKSAMLLLESAAILHAENGDGKQAAKDITTALALARSVGAEPTLISQLVRAASLSIALTSLEQTLNRVAFPDQSLRELFQLYQKMEDYDGRGAGFNLAFDFERACWIDVLESPQKLALVLGVAGVDISPEEHEAITARIQKGDHFKDEQQFLKKAGHQFMAARKEAFPERLKAEPLIHALIKEAGEKQFLISKHLLGGLAAPVLKEAGSLAQARLGLTALALEQFRATHENKYPSALSALTPDYLATIPADPFDGQSLRYRLKANGYLLYSIGPDLKDDSGDPIIGKNGDIVFMVVQTPKPL